MMISTVLFQILLYVKELYHCHFNVQKYRYYYSKTLVLITFLTFELIVFQIQTSALAASHVSGR